MILFMPMGGKGRHLRSVSQSLIGAPATPGSFSSAMLLNLFWWMQEKIELGVKVQGFYLGSSRSADLVAFLSSSTRLKTGWCGERLCFQDSWYVRVAAWGFRIGKMKWVHNTPWATLFAGNHRPTVLREISSSATEWSACFAWMQTTLTACLAQGEVFLIVWRKPDAKDGLGGEVEVSFIMTANLPLSSYASFIYVQDEAHPMREPLKWTLRGGNGRGHRIGGSLPLSWKDLTSSQIILVIKTGKAVTGIGICPTITFFWGFPPWCHCSITAKLHDCLSVTVMVLPWIVRWNLPGKWCVRNGF